MCQNLVGAGRGGLFQKGTMTVASSWTGAWGPEGRQGVGGHCKFLPSKKTWAGNPTSSWGLKGHPLAHAPGPVPGSPTPPLPGAVGPRNREATVTLALPLRGCRSQTHLVPGGRASSAGHVMPASTLPTPVSANEAVIHIGCPGSLAAWLGVQVWRRVTVTYTTSQGHFSALRPGPKPLGDGGDSMWASSLDRGPIPNCIASP